MTGVAVNVTAEPEQVGLLPKVCVTEMEGVSIAFTVMVITLDEAEELVTQLAFEFMIQVISCPLVRVDVVYVALFVPTFEPFTCH